MFAYDSDNILDIPSDAEIIAYYNDGEPGSATPEQLAHFPNAKHYPITRKTGIKAYWADVENGALTVSDFIHELVAGNVQGIYISWSRVQNELIPAVMAARVIGQFDLWSAHWDVTQLDTGAVWTQFQSPSSNPPSGGHFDKSFVWSGWIPRGEIVTPTEPQNTNWTAPDSEAPVADATGQELAAPIVGAVATPSGNGVWLFASDGGVFAFGDAQHFGSIPDLVKEKKMEGLNKPVVAMVATKSGEGYCLFGQDGGAFNFGNAAFTAL